MKERIYGEKRWLLGKWGRVSIVAILTGALLGTLIAVSGCAIVPRRRRRRARPVVVVDTPGVDVVYVPKAPPKPKVEKRLKRPKKKAVWVPGH